MSTRLHSGAPPFSNEEFEGKLEKFRELIREITLQDYEATPEERRQIITGKN